ncbi:MAG: tryptophan synthase subunit alpha [Oscillospiraceae bacterium]|nr:tryptophan synthase subunit alpha [Oscillospiraceae bacterium]
MSKFVSFITAGDPSLEKTKEFIDILAEYSEIIEVGLPFSDPMAEGEVIQRANERALAAGTTTEKMFEMLDEVTFEKMVILTYANPVYVYGYKDFFSRCKKSGVYGVIIPDIPYEERGELLEQAQKHGVHLITLIAPTSAGRVQMLAREATGFIYLVSSMGVTGARSEFGSHLRDTVAQIREVTDVPVYIGFGISTPEQASQMRKIADGVIVGSAFVKIIEKHGEQSGRYISEFIREMV